MTTREQLDSLLDQLQASLPILIDEHRHVRPFWPAFARAADVIEELTGPENWDHVQARLKSMLTGIGMIPGDTSDPSFEFAGAWFAT